MGHKISLIGRFYLKTKSKIVMLLEVRVSSENMVTIFVIVGFLVLFRTFFVMILPGHFKLFFLRIQTSKIK